MTREQAKEILQHLDDAVWKGKNLITCGMASDALQLAEGALNNPWHKASEELPEEDDAYYVAGVGFYDKANWCKGEWRNFPAPITHWMPIPELPKED